MATLGTPSCFSTRTSQKVFVPVGGVIEDCLAWQNLTLLVASGSCLVALHTGELVQILAGESLRLTESVRQIVAQENLRAILTFDTIS
ncbi:MAG: hypothetical protein AAF939_19875 [Planctomycetota bacterium]